MSASVGAVLCILPGPSEVLLEESAGDLWCFGCRKRLPHTWRLMGDKLPSYYEPNWTRKCDVCHEDHSQFPGSECCYGCGDE